MAKKKTARPNWRNEQHVALKRYIRQFVFFAPSQSDAYDAGFRAGLRAMRRHLTGK